MSIFSINEVQSIELGLGLIGIGRPWPTPQISICTEENSWSLLDQAIKLGIRFFDTAAAYGLSEKIFGDYLRNMEKPQRDRIIVATKCGEIWPNPEGKPVDHSVRALEKSLTNSLNLLGKIDLLQLHKATINDFRNESLIRWFESLKKNGYIKAIGVSISDNSALSPALDSNIFDTIQFPANFNNPTFKNIFVNSTNTCLPIINRPMGSGVLIKDKNAFEFHADSFKRAIILTGTTNINHLEINVKNFKLANERSKKMNGVSAK